MAKVAKIDLDVLKQLVGELESTLSTADSIRADANSKVSEYIVEMSKAAGLAAGVMQEAAMLVMDVQTAVQLSQGPAPKEDGLKSLMNILKGGGNLPGSN
jgi:hypothetical protein